MLEHALAYAGQGMPVVPLWPIKDGVCTCRAGPACDSSGKHPMVTNWPSKATTNPYTIEFWWSRDPEANIGTIDGIRIDWDTHRGGVEAYHAWCEDHPHLAATRTARTQSGGYHQYFQGAEPEGCYHHAHGEVRGQGALTVLPPSRGIHQRYAWLDPDAPILPISPSDLPAPVRDGAAPTPVDFVGGTPPAVVSRPVCPREGRRVCQDIGRPRLSQWPISQRISHLIFHPLPVGERSEADMAVITALVAAGASDSEIRAVFNHYPIGAQGKYADKGKYADSYLALSIGKARTWLAGN